MSDEIGKFASLYELYKFVHNFGGAVPVFTVSYVFSFSLAHNYSLFGVVLCDVYGSSRQRHRPPVDQKWEQVTKLGRAGASIKKFASGLN